MPIRIVDKSSLSGTDRHVRNASYETHRFLLAADGVGFTVTDIVLAPGRKETYGYDSHIEVAYCIQGRALITDSKTNQQHSIGPGVMWIAEKGSRFVFEASEPTRLICVFNPPFEGHETGFVGEQ